MLPEKFLFWDDLMYVLNHQKKPSNSKVTGKNFSADFPSASDSAIWNLWNNVFLTFQDALQVYLSQKLFSRASLIQEHWLEWGVCKWWRRLALRAPLNSSLQDERKPMLLYDNFLLNNEIKYIFWKFRHYDVITVGKCNVYIISM